MSKKFVNFRMENIVNSKVVRQLNHDFRIGWQPHYINHSKMKDNRSLFGGDFNENNIASIKSEQNKRSKRKIRKDTNRFNIGIMTFSETMQKDYHKDPMKFRECSEIFLDKLRAKGLRPLYAQLHLDETTPHIHILFDNLDENAKSINRQLLRHDFSEFQDLMGESFQPMGYQRGQSKNITNANHLSVSDYHELEKLEKELRVKIENHQDILSKRNKQHEQILKKIEQSQKITREEYEMILPFMIVMEKFDRRKENKKERDMTMRKAMSLIGK
jgi:hypothetical protein